LESGDLLLSLGGGTLNFVIGATNKQVDVEVFNFEVEGTHTYLVGDEQVVVHNAWCGWEARKASIPDAPGIYVIVPKDGDRYVGLASNLKNRLTDVWGLDFMRHRRFPDITNPETRIFTMQVDESQLNGGRLDVALKVLEKLYQDLIETGQSASITMEEYAAYLRNFGEPPHSYPTLHP
jgi:hypothetical protein